MGANSKAGRITEYHQFAPMITARLFNFDVGQSQLKPEHVQWLARNVLSVLLGGGSMWIVGLASPTGSESLNISLSRNRAESVVNFLRRLVPNGFAVNLEAGLGKTAARFAGLGDGTEDENWRAVLICVWNRQSPPNPNPPASFALWFRRYAPFDTFGTANPLSPGQGFEGDHRTTASTSIQATSRTYGSVWFNQFGLKDPVIGRNQNGFAGSSGSHIHLCDISGCSDERATAKVSMKIDQAPLAGPGVFGFTARTDGSNPLIRPSPDITTVLHARLDFSHPGFMSVSGEVFGDSFPNLEVFLFSFGSQRTALLVDGRTQYGPNDGPLSLVRYSSTDFLTRFNTKLMLDLSGELASNSTVSPIQLPTWMESLAKAARSG